MKVPRAGSAYLDSDSETEAYLYSATEIHSSLPAYGRELKTLDCKGEG